MCKFVPMCAGANVFVSTISITAIALDRFQVMLPNLSRDCVSRVPLKADPNTAQNNSLTVLLITDTDESVSLRADTACLLFPSKHARGLMGFIFG